MLVCLFDANELSVVYVVPSVSVSDLLSDFDRLDVKAIFRLKDIESDTLFSLDALAL